ncbi:MAG TPA: hypothetical protein VFW87_11775 [Pirellulales bacterium]|nr:hypothetical protein [Pirellulales bacterium]
MFVIGFSEGIRLNLDLAVLLIFANSGIVVIVRRTQLAAQAREDDIKRLPAAGSDLFHTSPNPSDCIFTFGH